MSRKLNSSSPPPFKTQKKRNIKRLKHCYKDTWIKESIKKNTGNLDQQAKHEK